MLVVNKITEDHLRNSMSSRLSRSELMVQNSVRSQLISKCIIVLYNSMNLTYVLRTLASYFFDDVQDRKFLAQVTFPVDGRQSPLYEFIFVGQLITASICFNSHALVEGFLVTTVIAKYIIASVLIKLSHWNLSQYKVIGISRYCMRVLKSTSFEKKFQHFQLCIRLIFTIERRHW